MFRHKGGKSGKNGKDGLFEEEADHTEERMLARLVALSFFGLVIFAGVYMYAGVRNDAVFYSVFTALTGQLAAQTSALHRALGVNGKPKKVRTVESSDSEPDPSNQIAKDPTGRVLGLS